MCLICLKKWSKCAKKKGRPKVQYAFALYFLLYAFLSPPPRLYSFICLEAHKLFYIRGAPRHVKGLKFLK